MDNAEQITFREAEVAQYQQNIELYQAIANGLPSEWPAHLAHLKGHANPHEAIASIEDLDDVALVSKLWAHDQAVARIRTEMVEKAKSEAILTALKLGI